MPTTAVFLPHTEYAFYLFWTVWSPPARAGVHALKQFLAAVAATPPIEERTLEGTTTKELHCLRAFLGFGLACRLQKARRSIGNGSSDPAADHRSNKDCDQQNYTSSCVESDPDGRDRVRFSP